MVAALGTARPVHRRPGTCRRAGGKLARLRAVLQALAVALVVLAWRPAVASLASILLVDSGPRFVTVLAELAATPPTGATTLLLTRDIVVEQSLWPAETATSALALKSNVTVVGSVPGSSGAYSRLDLDWSYRKLKLAPGVAFTMQHLVLSNFRSKFGNDFDLLTYGPGALLVLQDVVFDFPLCVAASISVAGVGRVPRSPRAPPALGTNTSAGVFQLAVIWPNNTYCYPSFASPSVCTFDGVRFVDVWLEVPTIADFQGAGGYDVWYSNVTRACLAMMTSECVSSLGAATCYNNAVFNLQRAKSGGDQGGDDPQHLAIILPSVICGTLLLLGLGACGLWLALGPTHALMARRRRLSPPKAGTDTTLVVTDIEGSTACWEALPSDVMNTALGLHHGAVRRLARKHHGFEFGTEDSFLLAFHDPLSAVCFAAELQRALLEEPWPLQLLHLPAQVPVWMARSPVTSSGQAPDLVHAPSGGVAVQQPSMSALSFLVQGGGGRGALDGDDGDRGDDSAMPAAGGRAGLHPTASALSWRGRLLGGRLHPHLDGAARAKRRRASQLMLEAPAPALDEAPGDLGGRTYLRQLEDVWHRTDDPAAPATPGGPGPGPGSCTHAGSVLLSIVGSSEDGGASRRSNTGMVSMAPSGGSKGRRSPNASPLWHGPSKAGSQGEGHANGGGAGVGAAGAVCMFRGLRVRVGMTSGVAPDDCRVNETTRKVQYSGRPLACAKAVCDAAQGGMTLLSPDSFRQLAWADDAEAPAASPTCGPPRPLPIYQALLPELAGRLVAVRAMRNFMQVSLGALEAPVGRVTVLFMHAVGYAHLAAWNGEVLAQASLTYAAVVKRQLAEAGGYLVELADGLCLAAFTSTPDAIAFALNVKDRLLTADWPSELLEHELCEVVETGVITQAQARPPSVAGGGAGPGEGGEASCMISSQVVLRGLRIRVGVDVSADVHIEISPSTGRMSYRGRVMNRAARISAKATSGAVLVSEEAWAACRGAAHLAARAVGCVELKGIGTLQLYACGWREGLHRLASTRRGSTTISFCGHGGSQYSVRMGPHTNDGTPPPEDAQQRSQGVQTQAAVLVEASTQTDPM
ncbi:hypothetical protein HYH03_000414 [Edaphochlamys debaryana]|uniref:Guanylate cyclase domain-containing protein n=1 Tax=Edaphochlamys debaryana TaxID=47281 RepID=A0A835YG37_9CHLO|nr:hypothetical protein HYH03_000414 [Edaphochlamys debaryana]|eukprot:KAG2501916.1 hypothetical protein HYH03_000414 [Edaphochlamys debaryana]